MLNLKFKDERNNERASSEVRSDYRSNSFNNQSFVIERGDIWFAELKGRGSEQQGLRPVVITANYRCLRYSPVITVVPVTSKLHKRPLPTHVTIGVESGLSVTSVGLVEGITSIDKSSLVSKIGHCSEEEMSEIEKAIQIQNGIKVKEDINEKIFDISVAKELADSIKELDEFIGKWDNPQLKPIKRSRKTLIDQLKSYCLDFNKNISLFYRDITVNNSENYKGRVMNA